MKPLFNKSDDINDLLNGTSLYGVYDLGDNALNFAIAPPKTSIFAEPVLFSTPEDLGLEVTVPGTEGADILNGTGGADVIDGLGGNDVIIAGGGNDFAFGGSGNDTIDGQNGNDQLFGGAGDDSLRGGSGSNTLIGGEGADTLVSQTNSFVDTVSYADATSGVGLNFNGTGFMGEAAGDTMTGGFEGFIGSDFDDVLVLTQNADGFNLNAGRGTDTLQIAERIDLSNATIFGFDDIAINDSTTGNGGTVGFVATASQLNSIQQIEVVGATGDVDIVINMAFQDTLDLSGVNLIGFGADDAITINGDNSSEVIIGSSHNDIIAAFGGDDTLFGGAGNDIVRGGSGSNTLIGGEGADTLVSQSNGLDTVSYADATSGVGLIFNGTGFMGEAEGDTMSGGFEGFIGSDFDDVLVLSQNAGGFNLNAGRGTDTLEIAERINLSSATIFGFDDIAINDSTTGNGGTVGFVATASQLNSIRQIEVVGATGDVDIVINMAFQDTLDLSGVNLIGFGADDAITINGDLSSEVIIGSSHNDIIAANGGDDTLFGGLGDDALNGQDGNDVLSGGAGADALNGGNGFDTATYAGSNAGVNVNAQLGTARDGDAEGDTLSGIENLVGSDFNDVLVGNDAINQLVGGDGDDTLFGQNGNDNLVGGAGDDILRGGNGNDVLAGGAGNDVLFGETGADTLVGGEGFDIASYEGTTRAIVLNLLTGTGTNDAFGDTFVSIEQITATVFNDILVGDFNDNIFDGGDGDDTIDGGFGDDFLIGGAGADTIDGGFGNDTVSYAGSFGRVSVVLSAATQFLGQADGDVLTNIENVIGSNNSDLLAGDAQDNVLDGGGGNDDLIGNAGNDTLIGGAGNDELSGGLGNDTLIGGAGNDLLIGDLTNGSLGIDTAVFAGNFADFTFVEGVAIPINDEGSTVSGLQVTSSLTGTDSLFGIEFLQFDDRTVAVEDLFTLLTVPTEGDDVLQGTEDADLIDALGGDDVINGLGGDDTLIGGAGSDTLNGGNGSDTFIWRDGDGSDTVNGGNRLDIFDSSASGLDQVINLNQGTGAIGSDVFTFNSVENVSSGAGNDTLTGNGLDNILNGRDGVDRLEGGAGNDELFGGTGEDVLIGGLGDDIIDGFTGFDTVLYTGLSTGVIVDLSRDVAQDTVGAGIDTLIRIENLVGSGQNDLITGSSNRNRLEGGNGDDIIDGLGGNDTLLGGNGDDDLIGGTGADRLVGGAGADDLTGGDQRDRLEGGSGDDSLFGGDDVDRLLGGDGDDLLVGGEGTDFLFGGAGADRFDFNSLADSGVGPFQRDEIRDFNSAEGDTIDVSQIDADITTEGSQDFVFAEDGFTGTAGEMMIESLVRSGINVQLVSFDVDGDSIADMQLFVIADELGAGDFNL